MALPEPFVDIHCHLLPGIDDGAPDLVESLAMARLAVQDGIGTIICTPHQLGNFHANTGNHIRSEVQSLQEELHRQGIPLKILPGADVRIEPDLVRMIREGDVVSLGDHKKHILLELPHEMYIPLDRLLQELAQAKMVGILSHPERNHGLLARPELIPPLVDQGCLMQVTAGALMGTFGPASQQCSEDLIKQGLVHFISTDAHGSKNRRPLMRRAYERVVELAGEEVGLRLCCRNPAAVAAGQPVQRGKIPVRTKSTGGWFKRRPA